MRAQVPNDFTGVSYDTGFKVYEYFVNGVQHREFGPASVWDDGDEEWFLNGTYYGVSKRFRAQEYWTDLYEIVKGTDREEECLAYLLGAK